jgi:hypothetical protein
MKAYPGFVAERSVYRTGSHYGASPRPLHPAGVTAALIDPGCFQSCYHHCNWDCFELIGPARSACLRECKATEVACRSVCTIPSCVPTTTCSQDPASSDSRCQICHRDNCDGTGSIWHTC